MIGDADDRLGEQRVRLDDFDDQLRVAARRALLQKNPHRGEVGQRGQAELRVADLFLVHLAAGRQVQVAQDVRARSAGVAAAFELLDHQRRIRRGLRRRRQYLQRLRDEQQE